MYRQVQKLRGKATERVCAHCEGQAKHWTRIHGKDGLDAYFDYMPLCHSCRRKYNMIGLGQTKENRTVTRNRRGQFVKIGSSE